MTIRERGCFVLDGGRKTTLKALFRVHVFRSGDRGMSGRFNAVPWSCGVAGCLDNGIGSYNWHQRETFV